MEWKELYNNLSHETIRVIEDIFSPNHRVKTFVTILADLTLADEIELVEELFLSKSFRDFLYNNRKISIERFQFKFTAIFKNYLEHKDSLITSKICDGFNSKSFKETERLFFKVPIDRQLFEMFVYGSMKILFANHPIYDDFVKIYDSEEFATFRSRYKNFEFFNIMHEGIVSTMLSLKKAELVINAIERLASFSVVRLFEIASRTDNFENLYYEIILSFSKMNFNYFYEYINKFDKRYPVNHETCDYKSTIQRRYLKRVMNAFKFMLTDHKLDPTEFRNFLKSYGSFNDEFEIFVYELTMDLDPFKSAHIITIMNGDAFSDIRQYFQNDKSIIQMLIRNIVTVISEGELDNLSIDITISDIILKLLLNLKVDKAYIRRRAGFYKELKNNYRSAIIENEFIRILMFEYIFLATGIVPNRIPVKMTYVIDAKHKIMVDYFEGRNLPEHLQNYYGESMINVELVKIFSDFIKSELLEKFRDCTTIAGYLITSALSIGKTLDSQKDFQEAREEAGYYSFIDEIITALRQISPENFQIYISELENTFRNEPARCIEAVKSDFWCRIYFEQALNFISEITIPLLGYINIFPDDNLQAYTNGREIYLPAYISSFNDPRENLNNNRNITMFAALALHEAAHIAAGSFHYSLSNILLKKEKPELYKNIWNWVEDYRVEQFIITLNCHPQSEELIIFLNQVGSLNCIKRDLPIPTFFLVKILSDARSNKDNLNEHKEYHDQLNNMRSHSLYTGRFTKFSDMEEYFTNRLINLKLENPLSTHKLTEELYAILQFWPDPYLNDYNSYSIGNNDKSFENRNPRPLSQEELDAYYRECNENPEDFFNDHKYNKNSKDYDIDDDILQTVDYENKGTIDYSTHTKADDLSAENQRKTKAKKVKKRKNNKNSSNKTKQKTTKKKVFTFDPSTKSKTKLSELEIHSISEVSKEYMEYFQNWEYLSHIIYKILADIMPAIEDKHEHSSFEGDINIDLLVEFLSNKNKGMEIPEFLDVYREDTRSLDVFIGLDCSGSTAAPLGSGENTECILDIEKAFAMIFGKAMKLITPNLNIAAFDSMTSTNIYRAETIEAVSSFTPGMSNRDGDFIRYVTNELKQSTSDIKYFFLISDGQPVAENYSGVDALTDTLLSMRECCNEGIKLIYFNCDLSKGEYFEEFKKEATYARYFNSPEELMPAIPEFVSIISKSIL